jgi:hypothetical protein
MIKTWKDTYIKINLIFAGVILLVIAYSGIFSPEKNNYPVVCIHEKLTGVPCVSCGLSHSFSLIVRGKFAEARLWNIYGMRVFLFFAIQLIMRVLFSLLYIKSEGIRKQLIFFDTAVSGIMLLVAFWPYLRWIANSV